MTAVVDNNVLNDNLSERPALGTTWLSMITSSILFYRVNSLRYACVKLSSNLPEITIPFEIRGSGVKAIDRREDKI